MARQREIALFYEKIYGPRSAVLILKLRSKTLKDNHRIDFHISSMVASYMSMELYINRDALMHVCLSTYISR